MAAKYAGQNNETVVVTDNATAAAAADDADADASGYVWQRRMRELQGAIILASLFEFVLGMTGLVGVLLHYIGPLTIASVIVMVALPMVHVASSYAQHNWLIAFLYVRPPQPDFTMTITYTSSFHIPYTEVPKNATAGTQAEAV